MVSIASIEEEKKIQKANKKEQRPNTPAVAPSPRLWRPSVPCSAPRATAVSPDRRSARRGVGLFRPGLPGRGHDGADVDVDVGPSTPLPEKAIRSALASVYRAVSRAPVDEGGVDDEDSREEAESRAKAPTDAAAAALSALVEEGEQSLRCLLAPLLLLAAASASSSSSSLSSSASSSPASSVLSLRSAPARLLVDVSADFAAALSSSSESGGGEGGGLQVGLERVCNDRLRELSSRAGFDDDGEEAKRDEGLERENVENRTTEYELFLAVGLPGSSGAMNAKRAPHARSASSSAAAIVDASVLMGAPWVSKVAATSAAARLIGASTTSQAARGGFERGELPAVRA